MAEDVGMTGAETYETGTWHDEFQLSDESRKYLSKYDAPEKAFESIVSREKMIGSMIKVPTDKDDEEKHTKFREIIHKYQGVPKSGEEYEVEHPDLPDGMVHNTEFENQMRQIAAETKCPKETFKALSKAFSDYQINQHLERIGEAKTTIDAMKTELGESRAKEVLGYKNEKGELVPGTAKRALMILSERAGLDYVDDHNSPQSKLLDVIEEINPSGCLGNKAALIQAGQYLWDNFFKEGSTPPAGAPSSDGDELFSDKWYEKTDEGKDVD